MPVQRVDSTTGLFQMYDYSLPQHSELKLHIPKVRHVQNENNCDVLANPLHNSSPRKVLFVHQSCALRLNSIIPHTLPFLTFVLHDPYRRPFIDMSTFHHKTSRGANDNGARNDATPIHTRRRGTWRGREEDHGKSQSNKTQCKSIDEQSDWLGEFEPGGRELRSLDPAEEYGEDAASV